MQSRDEGHGASPRSGHPSSHTPIRAEHPTPGSRTPPLGRNEAVRPRGGAWSRTLQDRPLNRKTLSNRPTLPTVPQRTTDHPKQTVERSDQESQTDPEECDARVDDEPLHREVEEAGAGVTTTRKPMLRAHATRVIERPGKRNTVAKTHFQSNLSHWTHWYVAGLCRTISHNVNTVLLQYAPNLFNLLLIHTTNANATVNLTITVLHNFKLKRDTVQTKNNFPAQ